MLRFILISLFTILFIEGVSQDYKMDYILDSLSNAHGGAPVYFAGEKSKEVISPVFLIFHLLFRLFMIYYSRKKAITLKRNETGWMIFGFLSPIIVYIVLQFVEEKPNQ